MSQSKPALTVPGVFSLITFPLSDNEIISFLESIPEAKEQIESCWTAEEESQLRSLITMFRNIDVPPISWELPPLSWTEVAEQMNLMSRIKKLNDIGRIYTAEMVERQWAKMKEWEDVEFLILALVDHKDCYKILGAEDDTERGIHGEKCGRKRRMSI
jgi:hypothetical protein